MTQRHIGVTGVNAWRECNRRAASGAPVVAQWASTASIRSATMLVILIIGFTAGPAVSL